ncbi:unnamed protein product [Chrysodeixis includens]|uniref:Uncharacterized protein n=1 Tax=Chrysodeixis includens TaxID=689277 RepID=A0A9P0BT01_CHRIL|nr:unnamed protein product [Chrysodeixis includens]
MVSSSEHRLIRYIHLLPNNLNSRTMYSLVLFTLVALGTCLAHYRETSDSRNFVIREEPSAFNEVLVECPVCDVYDRFKENIEECPIKIGDKSYKICKHGTYINEVCGKRTDCYRGEREICTEKRVFDSYGARCGPGSFCDQASGLCLGSIRPDLDWRHWMNSFTSRRNGRKVQTDEARIPFDGVRN